tara:strand:+ start:702 stop:1691 length:990 start_codon:yes stop_codon:yes gene_type:complete
MEKPIYILLIVTIIAILFVLFRYFSNDYIQYQRQNPFIVKGLMTQLKNQPFTGNIIKSIDRQHGIEFTYAFWLKINSLPRNIRDLETIFYKGIHETHECPGVHITSGSSQHLDVNDMRTLQMVINIETYIAKRDCESNKIMRKLSITEDVSEKKTICNDNMCDYDSTHMYCKPYDCNDLDISNENRTNTKPLCNDMDYCKNESDKCSNKQNEVCIIENIPFDKWFHTTIILMNHYLDVYINGNLYERFEIKGIPNQNDDKLIIGGDNPATASLMDLQYFNKAIPYYKIHKMMDKGDSKNAKIVTTEEDEPPYLGQKYWIGEDTLDNQLN